MGFAVRQVGDGHGFALRRFTVHLDAALAEIRRLGRVIERAVVVRPHRTPQTPHSPLPGRRMPTVDKRRLEEAGAAFERGRHQEASRRDARNCLMFVLFIVIGGAFLGLCVARPPVG